MDIGLYWMAWHGGVREEKMARQNDGWKGDLLACMHVPQTKTYKYIEKYSQ